MVVFGDLVSMPTTKNYYYTHSGLSNVLIGSFAQPVVGDTQGICFDNSNNLLCSYSYVGPTTADPSVIYQCSGLSNTILGSFATPGSDCQGVAFDGSNMITINEGDYFYPFVPHCVYTHSGISTNIIGSFTISGPQYIGGIAYYQGNLLSCGIFVSGVTTIGVIFQHSGISSTYTGSFLSPGTNNFPQDIYVNNEGNLISCDSKNEHIYIHSGISATLTGSFVAPGSDPVGVAIYDYYNILSSGYVKIQNSGTIIPIKLITIEQAESVGDASVRVALNENVYCADLATSESDTYASPVKIQTPHGLKIWRQSGA